MLIKLSNNKLSEERARKITTLGRNFFQKAVLQCIDMHCKTAPVTYHHSAEFLVLLKGISFINNTITKASIDITTQIKNTL